MSHDSFYIVDYGDLMASDYDGNHPKQLTHESNNPVAGVFMVVKDHTQNQLQHPMPFEAKVWLEEFTNTAKIDLIEIPQSLHDSMLSQLNKYQSINQLMKSDAKTVTKTFLDSLYLHINYVSKKGSLSDASTSLSGGKVSPPSGGLSVLGLASVAGNPFQSSVGRLNKSFIAYYCKRLDKDKNILSQDDSYYWWQRNPNIRYLPSLRQLEIMLKESMDKKPSLTK